MARPKQKYPVPHLLHRGSATIIKWSFSGKSYEFSVRLFPSETPEDLLYIVSHALRMGEFPDALLSVPSVGRYADALRGVASGSADAAQAMLRYETHLSAATSANQRTRELQRLGDLERHAGMPPALATADQVNAFLAGLTEESGMRHRAHWIARVLADGPKNLTDILLAMRAEGCPEEMLDRERVMDAIHNSRNMEAVPGPRSVNGKRVGRTYRLADASAGRSVSTRNRYLQTLRRFFRWCVAERIREDDPTAQLRKFVEPHRDDVVYFTREARDRVLADAEATLGEHEALSVWIAFYAGLRLGEIARLSWENVDLARGWICVRGRTKTGKHRDVPIHRLLSERLSRVSVRARAGKVFDWPEVYKGYAIRMTEALQPVDGVRPAWNVFRHTFCSLLALAGRSIDQIAALSGHTPDVCRRHYARLIPSDARATGIDLL